jgi:phage I-like protein
MINAMGHVIKLHEGDQEAHSMGFLVDLSTQQFADSGGSWIQAMPLGTYHHPIYGKIEITPERVQSFATNVKQNVRGQELDIDYDHKERTSEAAGWVKDAEARSDGLWLLVDWTKEALSKIKSKAYRYFSPEFVDKWKHPSTNQVHKDVLFGGGLTNRPFLKGILPINLSEVAEGGSTVDRALLEKLATRLGITFSEETTDEELNTLVAEAAEQEPDPEDETEEEEEETEEETEEDRELAQLAETSPALARLLSEHASMREQMTELAVTARLHEVETGIKSLTEGTKRVIPPKLRKKLADTLMALPKKQGDQIITVLTELFKDGTVKLGEDTRRDPSESKTFDDPKTQFAAEVAKLTEGEKGMSYADAVSEVSASNPELWEAYRRASFASDPVTGAFAEE